MSKTVGYENYFFVILINRDYGLISAEKEHPMYVVSIVYHIPLLKIHFKKYHGEDYLTKLVIKMS